MGVVGWRWGQSAVRDKQTKTIEPHFTHTLTFGAKGRVAGVRTGKDPPSWILWPNSTKLYWQNSLLRSYFSSVVGNSLLHKINLSGEEKFG